MINRQRLADFFKTLVEIDSVSKQEKNVCDEIIRITKPFNGEVLIDDSHTQTGSDTGNLIIKIPGNIEARPLILCAHMDTVEPGCGIEAKLDNGIFTSAGDTILGADDKSAIAIILETIHVLKENKLPHGMLELVFTTCEEIGLKGAKNMDYNLLTSTSGYILDSADTEGIVTQAPASNHLEFKVYGKDAHAGAHPEKGINAISLAAKAIAGLTLGRIDEETTCNIGVIQGGVATNIVPSLVTVKGEVRSHDEEKLQQVTDDIVAAFVGVIKTNFSADVHENLPRLETSVINEFPKTYIPHDHHVVQLAQKAAHKLGRSMRTKTTGGGSDANIFFKKKMMLGVLGTGMRDIHTVRESVKLSDMAHVVELMLEIIQLNTKQLPEGT